MDSLMAIARAAVDAGLAEKADYVDARVERIVREDLALKNGQVGAADAAEELGIGVRVVLDGAAGFAAAPLVWHGAESVSTQALVRTLASRAADVARALAGVRERPIEFAGRAAPCGEYATAVAIDPFAVPLKEKIELLQAADVGLRGASATVVREATLSLRRVEKWQASSEGASVHQFLTRTGAGMSTIAAAHGEVQRRSFPTSSGGNYKAGGFEHALAMDLPSHGRRLRDESVALCSADACPPGRRTLILLGSQLMLQIHESVGHPTELDRVLGQEVDLAGSSFLAPEGRGNLRFGSPLVNFTADSTVAEGLDTRGFDDECVSSQRWPIVRDGVFVGFHTSREWAAPIGESHSRGSARAESWYHPPIIRITNLSLEPGRWKLADLIADTQDGILCDTPKMWSIDDRRLDFQFTTEIGWEIVDGKLGRLLRDPTYRGRTPEFWGSCDAICDASHFELWGIANCGKGNPVQLAEMSHGTSPARFRNVEFVR